MNFTTNSYKIMLVSCACVCVCVGWVNRLEVIALGFGLLVAVWIWTQADAHHFVCSVSRARLRRLPSIHQILYVVLYIALYLGMC